MTHIKCGVLTPLHWLVVRIEFVVKCSLSGNSTVAIHVTFSVSHRGKNALCLSLICNCQRSPDFWSNRHTLIPFLSHLILHYFYLFTASISFSSPCLFTFLLSPPFPLPLGLSLGGDGFYVPQWGGVPGAALPPVWFSLQLCQWTGRTGPGWVQRCEFCSHKTNEVKDLH